jgi:hypothetical protein
MGVHWARQSRHTSQMDRLRMRGEELCSDSACKAFRKRQQDGLTTIAAAAVAAAWKVLVSALSWLTGFN